MTKTRCAAAACFTAAAILGAMWQAVLMPSWPVLTSDQDHAITHYPQIVTKLGRMDQGGWQAECSDGRLIRADLVLLATGNPPPQWPCPIHGEMAQLPKLENRLVQNPWDGQWLDHLPAQSRLAIIGGGLTALDAVTALARRRSSGVGFLAGTAWQLATRTGRLGETGARQHGQRRRARQKFCAGFEAIFPICHPKIPFGSRHLRNCALISTNNGKP